MARIYSSSIEAFAVVRPWSPSTEFCLVEGLLILDKSHLVFNLLNDYASGVCSGSVRS